MLDVCLLGTGGMMPLPDRWLTSCMTRLNGSSLLIDCGEGTQIAIRQKGWSVHDIDTICFTHYHGDHISGLPGLLLSIGNTGRSKNITLIGPKGLRKVVDSLRIIAPGLPYGLDFIELKDNEQDLSINGYDIHAFKVNHNVTCYGYRIDVKRNGKFYPEKARELNIPIKYWSILQRGECVNDGENRYTPDMVTGEKRRGLKLVYCTDTRPVESIRENAKSADLLILEGMYADEDKFQNAIEKKHMMFREAATIADEAEADELWLTHYSPSLVYPQNHIKSLRKVFENAHTAKDGMTKTLRFKE